MLRSEEYIPSAPTPPPEDEEPREPDATHATAAAAAATKDDEALPPLLGTAGTAPRYGFNRLHSGVFRHLREEMAEVLRVPDPEGTPEGVRTLVRGWVGGWMGC